MEAVFKIKASDKKFIDNCKNIDLGATIDDIIKIALNQYRSKTLKAHMESLYCDDTQDYKQLAAKLKTMGFSINAHVEHIFKGLVGEFGTQGVAVESRITALFNEGLNKDAIIKILKEEEYGCSLTQMIQMCTVVRKKLKSTLN